MSNNTNNQNINYTDEELIEIRNDTHSMKTRDIKPNPINKRRKQAEYICSDYMDIYLKCIRSGKRNCTKSWHSFNKCVEEEMVFFYFNYIGNSITSTK